MRLAIFLRPELGVFLEPLQPVFQLRIFCLRNQVLVLMDAHVPAFQKSVQFPDDALFLLVVHSSAPFFTSIFSPSQPEEGLNRRERGSIGSLPAPLPERPLPGRIAITARNPENKAHAANR